MDELDWNASSTLLGVYPRADWTGDFLSGDTVAEGSLANMVAYVARQPEHKRWRYSILSNGAFYMTGSAIMALAARSDFPQKMAGLMEAERAIFEEADEPAKTEALSRARRHRGWPCGRT